MRLRAFHLHKARYADQAFSGQGARLAGGRWNRPGTPMVYCAESLALATLEILVNLEDRRLLAGYAYASVEFAERLVEFSIRNDYRKTGARYRSPSPIAHWASSGWSNNARWY